jgi:hypothetical protein
MRITLNADGTFTWLITDPGLEAIVEDGDGTFAVEGTLLTLADSGEGSPEAYTAIRNGDSLTLTISDEWDFDGDEVPEDATLTIALSR